MGFASFTLCCSWISDSRIYDCASLEDELLPASQRYLWISHYCFISTLLCQSEADAKCPRDAAVLARLPAGKLAGLKQNLLAERAALEEKMQQLQRRLEAIEVLLEE